MLRLQQDDEFSGKKSPSLSGPIGYFWRKSIFRLCLFLDIWIMFYELEDAICGWLVKSEKIDGLLFLDILGRIYFYIASLKIDMSNIISS